MAGIDAFHQWACIHIGTCFDGAFTRVHFFEFAFDFAHSPQNKVVVILAAPGVARNPSPAWIVNSGRAWLGRVVVDGTNNHAACPRKNRSQRRSPQPALVVASLEIFHLSGATGCYPFRKALKLGEIADCGNSSELESRIQRGFPY